MFDSNMCLVRHDQPAKNSRYESSISKPEKVRNRHEHDAYHDEQNAIGYKIRENHQAEPAQQGHHRPLLSPIDGKSESYGPEQQSPK